MSDQRPPLRPDQYERYRRHLSLPQFGLEGQEKLLAGRVLLIGAGGLGSPLALYLGAAGVGTLGLVDDDVVDASNLQRQVLYSTRDLGRRKVDVARERLEALNPDLVVRTYATRLDASNALEIFADYDVIVDGTDNFPTRYLANDACVLLGKPNVHGAIFRFEGQATVFDATAGSLLPLPVPGTTAPRRGPVLCRGGRSRCVARDDRNGSGDRDRETPGRNRRAADRAIAPIRCFGAALQRVSPAQGSGLPGVWTGADGEVPDRLSRLLRSASGE